MDDLKQQIQTDHILSDPQLPFPAQREISSLQVSAPPPHVRRIRRKGKRSKKRLWKIILLTILTIIYVSTFVTAGFLYSDYRLQLPKVNQYVNESIPQDTHIYDRNNVLLYDAYDQNQVNGGRRVPVTLQAIPKVMQDAMIATEDKTFWTDPGINVQSTIRAALSRNGGGSTITQQVIKNLSHNTQHTTARKIQEALLAIGLTQNYTKAQILDMYFNVAAFGSFDIGVESAIEVYFHLGSTCMGNGTCTPEVARLEYNAKGQRDPILGLARASLLAGMPNAPGMIDPTLGPQAKQLALARQKIVLQAMITQHMSVDGQVITTAMAKQAENMMAQTNFEPYQHTKRAPYFVDWIINQLAFKLGDGDYAIGFNLLEHNGYNIHTTLDLNLEQYIERAINQHLNKPDYQYYPLTLRGNLVLSSQLNIHSAAVVVLDAKTGEILAMDGGADYNSTNPAVGGEYNMTDPPSGGPGYPSGRPPGATILPIDYAAVYAKEGSQAAPVLKHQSTFDADLTNASSDAASLATASAGLVEINTTARNLGITVPQNAGTNFAAGSGNISLLQMTGAYQALANQGQRVPPVGLLDIYDRNGHRIYHYNTAQPPSTPAVSATVANQITADLSNEPARADKFGDDQLISFADQDANCATSLVCKYPVAAQSSNTDETEDGNTTIGYTSDVVVGSWVGNVNGARMSSDTVGSTGALPIWHSVIERALGWCGTQPTSSPYFLSDHVACGPAPHLRFSSTS